MALQEASRSIHVLVCSTRRTVSCLPFMINRWHQSHWHPLSLELSLFVLYYKHWNNVSRGKEKACRHWRCSQQVKDLALHAHGPELVPSTQTRYDYNVLSSKYGSVAYDPPILGCSIDGAQYLFTEYTLSCPFSNQSIKTQNGTIKELVL